MSSRIEQLIDELEEYIESCKPKFMSNSEIIVNKDEIDELIRELRMKTPDEIRRYQKIINNKEAILNDARSKAQALIDEATVHTNELVSEHEIMQQAYSQANGIVATAARQAQEILDKATKPTNCGCRLPAIRRNAWPSWKPLFWVSCSLPALHMNPCWVPWDITVT